MFNEQAFLRNEYEKEQNPAIKSIFGKVIGVDENKPKNKVDEIMGSFGGVENENNETPWYKTQGGASAIGGILSGLGAGLLGKDLNSSLAYGLIGAGKTANSYTNNQRENQNMAMKQNMLDFNKNIQNERMEQLKQRVNYMEKVEKRRRDVLKLKYKLEGG